MSFSNATHQLTEKGYSVVSSVFNADEINRISEVIDKRNIGAESVIVSTHLYAIRQLLLVVPEVKSLVINNKLKALLSELDPENELFLTKAIYFDKPKNSNWFVSYHQDLTINVSEKHKQEGFSNWTQKRGQIGVQPPLEFLENTITLRIHLDDTDETNGALRVIPESHLQGVIRKEHELNLEKEETCKVQKGGVMLMKPLILHASSRSRGELNRRVIHLEFCSKELPEPLSWKEKEVF